MFEVYTLEEKTNFWLVFQHLDFPSDIINLLWTTHLQQIHQYIEPTPSKLISKRTTDMMRRWRLNGLRQSVKTLTF